jgi:hypothetical protein
MSLIVWWAYLYWDGIQKGIKCWISLIYLFNGISSENDNNEFI